MLKRCSGHHDQPCFEELPRRNFHFFPAHAISHRIVAREPVTDRLGPRFTPIKTACESCGVSFKAAPPASATGRLFIALDRMAAAPDAARQAVSRGLAGQPLKRSLNQPQHARAVAALPRG